MNGTITRRALVRGGLIAGALVPTVATFGQAGRLCFAGAGSKRPDRKGVGLCHPISETRRELCQLFAVSR